MKDITPEGSIVPIYLDPIPIEQKELSTIAYAEKQAKEQAKEEAKATAQAKLAALGLTIADLEALGL